MTSARQLQKSLEYSEWRNFEGVVRRARQLIAHGFHAGTIQKSHVVAEIGSGAKRKIVDYLLDDGAVELVTAMCANYKLVGHFPIRNEAVVLSLVEKWCVLNGVDFRYQYELEGYIYDCLVDGAVLIEFDEPHHKNSPRQAAIDRQKDITAVSRGFKLLRVTVDDDVIDIVHFLQQHRDCGDLDIPT